MNNGSQLAIAFGMRNNAAIHRNGGIASFVQGVRAFAEASLVALGFGFAILLIGLPIALSVRVVHESLSWLARLGGDMNAAAEALISVASVVGGIVLTAAFARELVGLFRWRRALRGDGRSGGTAIHRTAPALPATGLSARRRFGSYSARNRGRPGALIDTCTP